MLRFNQVIMVLLAGIGGGGGFLAREGGGGGAVVFLSGVNDPLPCEVAGDTDSPYP